MKVRFEFQKGSLRQSYTVEDAVSHPDAQTKLKAKFGKRIKILSTKRES